MKMLISAKSLVMDTRIGCICTLLLAGSFVTSGQEPGAPQIISQGQQVKRELTAGQVHAYQIKLEAGEYLRVVAEERGIELVMRMLAPDRTELADSHATHRAGGINSVSIVAEGSGMYALEVRSLRKEAAPGYYEMMIAERRLPTEKEKVQSRAERSFREADLLNTRASVDDRRQAIRKFEEAARLSREIEDRKGEIKALTSIGSAYEWFGELEKANLHYQQAIQIAQSIGDRRAEANLHFTMGKILFLSGDRQEALTAYQLAGQLFHQTSARLGESQVLATIGTTYLAMGDFERALEFHERALPAFVSLQHVANEAVSLTHLGVIHFKLGDRQKALSSLNKALEISRRIAFPLQELKVLTHLGDIHLSSGERDEALKLYTQALKIAESGGFRIDEAILLRSIGDVALLKGEVDQALVVLDQALNKFVAIGDRANKSSTLHSLARVNASNGNLVEARRQIEAALDLKESLRSRLVDRELRITTAASMQSSYDLYVDLLCRLHEQSPTEGFDRAALEASERARARGLLEMLIESGVDIREGVSPELLALETSLQQQINAKAATRARVTEKTQAAALDKEISQLTSRYLDVESQIRTTSPRYAALSQPQALSATKIQQLLDEQTVLLEFSLGDEKSRLLAVTPRAIAVHSLASRSQIESAARNVYGLMTARQPKQGLTATQMLARIGEADGKFPSDARELSQMLLGPIAAKLSGEWKGRRLAIVASGALEYLPFAALPVPETEKSKDQSAPSVPLIASHEVINLPSASVLALIRNETRGRAPGSKAVAVFADPVFETSDPRLVMASNASSLTPELARSVRSFGRAGFGRLVFSREEADSIVKLAPASSTLKATGFEANRPLAASGDLSRYRIVHFATHGLINSERPELSGLVLSLLDENGRPQDGFLRMRDIYNLHLPAELVVLSACETALGKQIRGEGLVGLTRGFIYAGTERVVASLWQVDDQATAQLMQAFYRGMLKENLRPAAALRAAQIEMSRQKRWTSPYYWAGFIIQGEYK